MCAFQPTVWNLSLVPAVLLVSICIVPGAGDASTEKDKAMLIDMSSAPAAPPESAEARIALRQHREATALNRFTFPGNVLQGTGDLVENWIVIFCPGWHDKCQGLLPSYELLGVQWENKLNKAVMSSRVRFAKVDCATDKRLCVSLGIDDYPSVVHYRSGARIASWQSGAPGLVGFVKQALEGPRRRASSAKRRKVPVAMSPSCAADGGLVPDTDSKDGRLRSSMRSMCFAMILLAVAGCLWALTSKACAARGRQGQMKDLGKHGVARSNLHFAAASSVSHASLPEEWARRMETDRKADAPTMCHKARERRSIVL